MRAGLALWLAVAATACTTLPPPGPKPESQAIVDATTPLAHIADAGRPSPELSGFRLLPTGGFSYGARLDLAARATRSIDAQYYILSDDPTGRRFLRALRDAAARGVRVRLLVDDLFTGFEEGLLAGLAAHPNVEVRLFNPLPVRGGSAVSRIVFSRHEFARINHRMHNKLFIADNAAAVTGGRNMADEYFMAGGAANFVDIDVLATGPVVRELSSSFDAYWNSEQVYSLQSVQRSDVGAEAARAAFESAVADPPRPEDPRPDPFGQGSVGSQLAEGRLRQIWATARVFVDPPGKAAERDRREASAMMSSTLAVIGAARDEVLIVSPYFIPGPIGMGMMKAARDAGVRVELITNALGSTDEPLVHGRYATYRRPMLELGVRIFELSATRTRASREFGDFGASLARLHAKAAIIDRRYVFIGSMNLDGRSALANTELGLVVDSPDLAAQLGRLVGGDRRSLYELRLTADRQRIEWVWRDADGRTEATVEEPDDSWWRRFKLWLFSPFVAEELL